MSMLSKQFVKLYQTLNQRWRPEDIAELILKTDGDKIWMQCWHIHR